MASKASLDRTLHDSGWPTELYTGELELLGTWEVAHYLGVERSRIARWLDDIARGKDSIEPPVARLKSGPFWTKKQIVAKAKQMYEADKSEEKPPLDEWLAQRRAARAAREGEQSGG